METLPRNLRTIRELTRRDLLKAGLAAGAALSTGPLIAPAACGRRASAEECSASGAMIRPTSIRT